MTAGYSFEEALLKATGAQVTSQGMLKAKSQLVEVPREKVTVTAMFELVSMRCPILSVDRLVRKEVVVVMENERRYKSYKKNREIPLHKYHGVYHVHESELSESCPLEDPSNVDEPVTVSVTTMPWTRGFSHKYTQDERMLQSVGVTAILDLSTSVFVWAGGIGILDSWDHREVMIMCDQEQSLNRPAELFREQRRPRSRMVENTHCDMEGLARTRRSDPIERTGASLDVKLLLTSWLVRKRIWSSMGFAMDVAGLSDFKRQCKDHVGESLNEAICCRVSVRIQSEVESRWKADGVFMGKLDLPDEVIVDV